MAPKLWSKIKFFYSKDDQSEERWRPTSKAEYLQAALKLQDQPEPQKDGHESPQDCVDALDNPDEIVVPKIKRRRRPKLAAAETQKNMKTRAAKGWLTIVMRSPASSQAGRRVSNAAASEHLEIIECYLMDKAPTTAVQRLAPISLMARWFDANAEGWPPSEEAIVRYVTCNLSVTAAKTSMTRLLEAVKFMAGTFQYAKSTMCVGESRYLAGKALQQLMLMPRIKKTKALTLEFLSRLEHYYLHADITVELKMVAGGLLFLAYYRIRFNDADEVIEVIFYMDRITAEVRDTKTSGVREVVILMTPAKTLTNEDWLEDFFQWREQQGAPLGGSWPLFPARDGDEWIKQQCKVADVNEVFWAIQIQLYPLGSPPERKTSHACKHAMLDAAAVWGLDKPTRRCLGYHKDPTSRAVDTYAPSTQIVPVRRLGEMIEAYSEGKFDPDATRKPMARKMMAAKHNEMSAGGDTSSDQESASEAEQQEPSEEVRQRVQEEIVDACSRVVTPTDQRYMNLNNNKIHCGREGDETLTACGNPIGLNIVPMATGEELEQIDIEFICQNCFGRSLEKRQAVARRMSKPAEPLCDNLQVK